MYLLLENHENLAETRKQAYLKLQCFKTFLHKIHLKRRQILIVKK